MISGPVMASVFVIGLNSGSGVGMGACFFLGAVRILKFYYADILV